MTSGEGAPHEAFDIPAALIAADIGIGPVENSRRLVPLSPATNGRVLEFFSSHIGARILALPARGDDSRWHAELSGNGMPTLPRTAGAPENLTLLQVPRGTWPLGQRLHLIPRDFGTYSRMLLSVANSQRYQHDMGMGVLVSTEGMRVVDNFAFTPDMKNTETGQRMYVIPPYNVDREGTPELFVATLAAELEASGEFTPPEMDYLRDVLVQGARGDGRT